MWLEHCNFCGNMLRIYNIFCGYSVDKIKQICRVSQTKVATLHWVIWVTCLIVRFLQFCKTSKNIKRICLKFYFKLEETGITTREMIKLAYEEKAMARTRVFEWFPPLKRIETRGKWSTLWMSINGWESAYVSLKVCEIFLGSCNAILTEDFNIKRVVSKFVLRLLMQKTKNKQTIIAVKGTYVIYT